MIDDFCHIIYPQDSVSDELRLINHSIKQHLENFTNLSGKDKPLKISTYKMKIGVQTVEYLNQIFHKGQTTIDSLNYEKIYELIKPHNKFLQIQWTPELTKEYENLIDKMKNITSLRYVEDASHLFIYSDASKCRIAAWLLGEVNDEIYPIKFYSRILKPPAKWNTHTNLKE